MTPIRLTAMKEVGSGLMQCNVAIHICLFFIENRSWKALPHFFSAHLVESSTVLQHKSVSLVSTLCSFQGPTRYHEVLDATPDDQFQEYSVTLDALVIAAGCE